MRWLVGKECATKTENGWIRIENSTLLQRDSDPKPARTKGKAAVEGAEVIGVSLADIINAGILNAPLKLFRKYKGNVMEGKLLSNGGVDFHGTVHTSCSAAASSARESITGRPMATNGWEFWQFRDRDGTTFTLTDARARYILGHGKKAN